MPLIADMEKEKIIELRNRCAETAMLGMLSNETIANNALQASKDTGVAIHTVIARNAIAYADALVQELLQGECVDTDKVNDGEVRMVTDGLLDSELSNTIGLSVRTIDVLKLNKIRTVRDLVRLKRTEFLNLRLTGRKSFEEVTDFLADNNLTWGMNV